MTDEIDEQYRRAAADHPSRPSDAVRRAVLAHSAAVAAQRDARGAPSPSPVRTATARRRWRPAAWGGLAAAGLAGLLLLPRLQELPKRSLSPAATEAVPPTAPQSNEPAARFAPAAPALAPRAAREDLAKSFDAVPRAALPPSRAAIAGGGAAADGTTAAEGQAKALADSTVNSAAALHQAAAGGDLAGLRTLLDEGADAESRDAAGRTALLLAVMHGHADAVDLLVARGANPNAEDTAGLRPLAAAIGKRRPDIAGALRRAGAR